MVKAVDGGYEERWRGASDEVVLKAASEDMGGYAAGVREVILGEVRRRGLEGVVRATRRERVVGGARRVLGVVVKGGLGLFFVGAMVVGVVQWRKGVAGALAGLAVVVFAGVLVYGGYYWGWKKVKKLKSVNV